MPQVGASNKNHIDGELNPMYGSITGLGKNECPDVKMGHLAALVAIKIVHDGGEGPIVIKDASFSVANTPVVGDCVVTFSDRTPTVTPSSSNTSTITTVELQDAVTITPDEGNNTVTLYAAVIPINDAAGKKATVTVNGSARTITLPSGAKFESGKVTTLKVPVKNYNSPLLGNQFHTFASDALTLTSKGRLSTDTEERILTIGGETKATINGVSNVNIYVVGSEGSAGSVSIKGFAKDIINALPIGFYASRWDDKATAMTLKAINIDIPEYKEERVYIPFVGYVGTIYYSQLEKRQSLASAYGDLAELLGWDISNGITRELLINTIGIDAKTITFNGIVSNGYFSNQNIVVLDDNPVHKVINETNVETYIKKFGSSATLNGLRDILNAEFSGDTIDWTTEANNTGNAIYSKIFNIIKGKVGGLAQTAMDILGFEDAEAFMYKLRDMKFEIEVETYPYAQSYSGVTPTTTLQPIVFWGLDATTEADKAAASTAGTEE